jgi:chromate transporter
MSASRDLAPLNAPQSRADLFWSFNWLALQGFGGVLAIVQRELVEKKRWLTLDQFAEDWAVAQIMPGPNVMNLSLMIGGRHFGWSGAACALAGMIAAPVLVVLLLAALLGQWADAPTLQGAMRGLAAVSAGMIASLSLKMLRALRAHVLGKVACASIAVATFIAVAVLRLPLIAVLLGLGTLSVVLTYRLTPPRAP